MDGLEEIRIRVNQPIELEYADETRCLTNADDKITGADIAEMLSYISEYSLYAYQEELRQGYITIEGGHGIGIANRKRQGRDCRIKYVSFMNIRVAHEKKDAQRNSALSEKRKQYL